MLRMFCSFRKHKIVVSVFVQRTRRSWSAEIVGAAASPSAGARTNECRCVSEGDPSALPVVICELSLIRLTALEK